MRKFEFGPVGEPVVSVLVAFEGNASGTYHLARARWSATIITDSGTQFSTDELEVPGNWLPERVAVAAVAHAAHVNTDGSGETPPWWADLECAAESGQVYEGGVHVRL